MASSIGSGPLGAASQQAPVNGDTSGPVAAIPLEVVSRPLDENYTLVELRGEIDMATSPALKEALYGLIESGHVNIVLNFDDVRYLDSAGLGVLVGALKRVNERGGRLQLVCKSVRIQKLFIITGLSRVFDVFSDEEALRRKLGLNV